MNANIEDEPVTWGGLMALAVCLIAVGGSIAVIGFVMWAKSR